MQEKIKTPADERTRTSSLQELHEKLQEIEKEMKEHTDKYTQLTRQRTEIEEHCQVYIYIYIYICVLILLQYIYASSHYTNIYVSSYYWSSYYYYYYYYYRCSRKPRDGSGLRIALALISQHPHPTTRARKWRR
jgi:hypothetical protein